MKKIDPKIRIQRNVVIDPVTDCWNWQGALLGKEKLLQYGRISVGSRTKGDKRTTSTHRYSYQIFVGEIPEGLWVLHKCDNPKCCNPDHLFLGTRQDNVNDREKKGRNIITVGSKRAQAKIDENIAYLIKEMTAKGIKQAAIMKQLNVTKTIIKEIRRGRTWKHVILTGEAPQPPIK